MRLAEVRAGMKCTGLSVVRGTAISEFDVEVIDVISGDSAAPGARILIRVSGPAVDATGVGPGLLRLADHLPRLRRRAAQRRRDLRERRRVRQQGRAGHADRADPRRDARRRRPGGPQRPGAAPQRPADRHPAHGLRALVAACACACRARPGAPGAQVLAAPAGPARRLPRPGPAARARRCPPGVAERRPHDRLDRHRRLPRRQRDLGVRPPASTPRAGARSRSRTPTCSR